MTAAEAERGMDAQRPSVSVVLPVYNGGRYLREALDSILAQGYEPLEVVVVDDGSTDDSAAIATERPVRLIRRSHAGIAPTRNAGLAAARGDLIAFLDADDMWFPDSLATRVDYLLLHPEVDYVLAHMEIFAESELEVPSWLPADWASRPQPGMLSTFLGRASAIETVGAFDESFELGEDGEWLARLKDCGARGAMLDAVCSRYRRHDSNTTITRGDLVQPTLVRAMKASIERKRAAL